MQARREQAEMPQMQVLDLGWCGSICRACFYMYVLSFFIGGFLPTMIINNVAYYMKSDSNVEKYDFKTEWHQDYANTLVTPNLGLNYFVSDKTN